MFIHKFSERKNILCVLYKKTNLCMNIRLFTGYIFVFLPMPHKMFFFVKNLCGDIKCPGLHAKFIFDFFDFLKFVFYVFSIIGLYRPESQNTSSIIVSLLEGHEIC
jgi:hypothetical protein